MGSGRNLRRTRTSGHADARCGPSRGEAAARCTLRAQIHHSRFKIRRVSYGFGTQLAKRSYERTQKRTRDAGLRAAKLRPARSWQTDPNSRQARSRADGPATERSSPPPGGGCGLLRPFGRKCIIQNWRDLSSIFGSQPAEVRTTIRSCGPPPPPGCGPPIPAGSICAKKPAAE